jgi:DHA2 family metal-tetracycline-proton antiporter-like MFS transporter
VDEYLIENPKHQNLLIALICAGAFIANLDATIVNITLPVLSQEFSVSPSTVSWTVLTYLLFEAGFMLPMGKLADMKGVRTVYLAGFVVFLLGSLACGVSSSIDGLIAFRAFQGIGGAMLFTVMMSFIPIYLPPGRRVFATGLVTTAAAAGVGLGPPLGGWLASTVGWRWIFFVNIPFCLAAIVAGRRYIPTAFPRIRDRRFDLAGAVFSFLAFVFFLLAVNKGLEWGWTSPAILACFGASALALALFIRREKKIDYPLIRFRLFTSRIIAFGLLSLSVSLMTAGGVLFIFPFYLMESRGLDVHIAELIMILLSLGQFIGPYMGRLSKKFGESSVCLAGLAVGVLSFLFFLGLGHETPLYLICLALGLFGLSQGISKAPSIALVMDCAPPAEKNALAGVVSLCRSLSIALGVLFFETVFSGSIPHSISLNDTHIAAAIAHPRELAAGFHDAFLFGALISLIAVVLMFLAGRKAHHL